jgi:hypothetical protein
VDSAVALLKADLRRQLSAADYRRIVENDAEFEAHCDRMVWKLRITSEAPASVNALYSRNAHFGGNYNWISVKADPDDARRDPLVKKGIAHAVESVRSMETAFREMEDLLLSHGQPFRPLAV